LNQGVRSYMSEEKPKKKVNYLNNRDILKEIHKSKNTYCSFRDRETDHQFDIILPNVEKINLRTVKQDEIVPLAFLKKLA